ncbi:GNAT family N-acetyltransferase [Paraflavitalea soli]|uniref:GNAT family N-acetyltransferase n=1 Tax=Paraflavitalea soli TaxID=2315862 RepID=A0A3B7MLS4_9BACT|nr:arsenic resistance N-acetyltransferase ArsN2 [Paraflavitalea soli]AXY72555.1 GNAT family N-acetyltransferase [Paraflavitalea soli]
MNICTVIPEMRNDIIKLLQSQQLPVADLPLILTDFFVAKDAGKIVGVIGMERYGTLGLLRSMAVHPGYRNQHIAANLVQELEKRAESTGIQTIYLLTETASGYFTRKGFTILQRDQVPDAVKSSSEFSHVCPVSAMVMAKDLIH